MVQYRKLNSILNKSGGGTGPMKPDNLRAGLLAQGVKSATVIGR